MQNSNPPQKRDVIYLVTKAYRYLLVAGFAILPSFGTWYLLQYQSPEMCFSDHSVHHVAVGLSVLLSGLIAYVTWRCYRLSGEPVLRWLTLGFMSFTLIYALHGAFTNLSDHDLPLFLLYGPVSRLSMAILLFFGLLNYGQGSDAPQTRENPVRWWYWSVVFVVLDILVALVAETSLLKFLNWRILFEGGALGVSALGAIIILLRHRTSPMMMNYGLALVLFVQSSIAFLLARPWNHLWWYAHFVFAAGFLLLSYSVIRAFHTTHAFSTVYSEEEMMRRLQAEKAHADALLAKLQAVNVELAWHASTDALTGASNRRHFMEQVEVELARAKRNGLPVSVIVMDIDFFKAINDEYGHQAGDAVLKSMVAQVSESLRPHDLIGRIGGEEFMVLLPDTPHASAATFAERVRQRIASMSVAVDDAIIYTTVSIGVAEFGRDGASVDQVFKVADERLYQAKHAGRNCVIA